MSPIERFLAKVDLTAGPANCQPWTAAHTKDGYGVFWDGEKQVQATRWLLGYLRGRPLGPGEWGLHHCDWPPCMNPLHLYVGGPGENNRDAIARGRRDLEALTLASAEARRGRYTARCGTTGGYSFHRRHGQQTCRACRDAWNTSNRARRAARGAPPGEEQ
jgi:hypothetical protein